MAYESKVSRKYFGSTFAGRVQPEKETQLKQLSKSLASVSPQLANMGTNYALGKKQDAVNELNLLRAQGKSAEEINAIILKGDNTALSNMYSESVVQAHNGKFAAADVLNDIKMDMENNYDYTTQNLQEYFAPFLEKYQLDNQSTNYQTGFAAVFNEQASKLKIKDAEDKGKYYKEQKLINSEKLISKDIVAYEDIDDPETGIVARLRSLTTPLPNVDGSTASYLSPSEMNQVQFSYIQNLFKTAPRGKEGIKQLEWAKKALKVDLGVGKGGNKLGTLVDRNDNAQTLLKNINEKLVALENQQRVDDNKIEQEEQDKFFTDFLNLKEPTYSNLQDLESNLTQYGEEGVELIDAARKIFAVNRFTNTDPSVSDAFITRAMLNEFATVNDLVKEAEALDIPQTTLKSALQYHRNAKSDARNGVTSPIFETNVIYSNSKRGLVLAVKETMKNQTTGNYDRGADLAAYNATTFMNRSIMEYERENPNVTDPQRMKFMNELGAMVKQAFNITDTPQTNPSQLQGKTALGIVQEQKEQRNNNVAIETDKQQVIDGVMDNINTFEVPNDFVYPQFERDVAEEENPNVVRAKMSERYKKIREKLKTDQRAKFREEEYIPAIENLVSQMIDRPSVGTLTENMTNIQYASFVESIANAAGISKEDANQVLINFGVSNIGGALNGN